MNQIEIQNNLENSISDQSIKKIVREVLTAFDLNNTFLEVIFVTPLEISKLNKKYREIDKPTDVLSFPQPIIAGAEIRVLGSLVIAEDIVKEKEENFIDVIKHGLLHLLDFDHETDEANWQKAADKINCQL